MGEAVIYKYPVGDKPGSVWVPTPRGAEILSVGTQGSVVVVWALVNPRLDVEPRLIELVWTGRPPMTHKRGRGKFIGTVQADSGLVYHVFDGGTG